LPAGSRWDTYDANSFCTNGVFLRYFGIAKLYVCKGHIVSITAAVDKAAADAQATVDVKAAADAKAAYA